MPKRDRPNSEHSVSMFLARVVMMTIGVVVCLALYLSASQCNTEEHLLSLLAGLFVMFLVFDIVENQR